MNAREFLTAIHNVARGYATLENCNLPNFESFDGCVYSIQKDELEPIFNGFSKRECEVLTLFVEGLTPNEIANKLGLSYQNAYIYLNNSFAKFNKVVLDGGYSFVH